MNAKHLPLFLLLLAQPVLAQTSLRLSDFFIDLHDEQRTGALFAHNEGTEPLYLKVEVVEVLNPRAVDPETRWAADPRDLGLLVSPQRLVLKPGEEGRIRALALAEPQTDRFYRVSVVPVTGALDSETPVGIKVMIGYSAWVYIRPHGERPELLGKRTGSSLTLTNNGGTLAQLVMGEQCDTDHHCEKLPPLRVLAGQQRQIDLPYEDGPATFRMIWGNESRDLAF